MLILTYGKILELFISFVHYCI